MNNNLVQPFLNLDKHLGNRYILIPHIVEVSRDGTTVNLILTDSSQIEIPSDTGPQAIRLCSYIEKTIIEFYQNNQITFTG